MRRAVLSLLLIAACGGPAAKPKGIRVPEARSCGERPPALTQLSVRNWGGSCVQAAREAEESLEQAAADGRRMNDGVLADCLDSKRAEVHTVREVMARDIGVVGQPGPLELDAQLIERRYERIERIVDEALECQSGAVAGVDAAR